MTFLPPMLVKYQKARKLKCCIPKTPKLMNIDINL